MISVRTLAEAAYEAYVCANTTITVFRHPNGQPLPFNRLSYKEQNCWVAAVQAVRRAMAAAH
jgi:hypothetical protein